MRRKTAAEENFIQIYPRNRGQASIGSRERVQTSNLREKIRIMIIILEKNSNLFGYDLFLMARTKR